MNNEIYFLNYKYRAVYEGRQYEVKITNQSHLGGDFFKNSKCRPFGCLYVNSYPERIIRKPEHEIVNQYGFEIYVKGSTVDLTNPSIYMNPNEFYQFQVDVENYNNTNGGKWENQNNPTRVVNRYREESNSNWRYVEQWRQWSDTKIAEPVGITSRIYIDQARLKDINEAIVRYKDAKHDIPWEWIAEKNEIETRLKKVEKSNE